MIFKKRAPSKITFVFNGHKTVYFNQKKARLTYNSLIFKSNGKDQLKNNSIESHAEIYRIYLILNVIIKPIMCIFRKCFLLLVMVTILSVAKGMDLLELIEKNQMNQV